MKLCVASDDPVERVRVRVLLRVYAASVKLACSRIYCVLHGSFLPSIFTVASFELTSARLATRLLEISLEISLENSRNQRVDG